MDIPKLVREIHKEIKKAGLRNVSSGGCGYFVLFVANELEKYGVPYQIRVVDGDPIFVEGCPIEEKKQNIEGFLKKIENIKSALVSFEHCWIEIKQDGMMYDFDAEDAGTTLNASDYNFRGFYTKKEMKIALRYGEWNPMYDVNDNQKLRAAIRKAFLSMHILRLLPII